jgi:outer membrane protein assembly factor BamB
VYFVAAGLLYSVAAGGTKNWQYTIDDASTGNNLAPVIGADGTIYVGSHFNRTLYAINPDGTKKWSVSGLGGSLLAGTGESAGIGGDGTVYIAAGSLYAFSPTGSNLWASALNDFDGASPTVGKDGSLYVGSYPGKAIYAFAPNGQTVWHALSENYSFGPPPPTVAAIGDAGTVYYCVSNSVFALSQGGEVLWVVAGGEPGPGVYLATTSPAVSADGTIYAALGSKLYAIAGTNALANAPWPMYRQNPRHTGKVEKPVLRQPQKRSDANFEFQLYPQQLGLTYTVESSSDLYNWTSMTSFVANTLPTDVVDLTASNAPTRVYRAFSGP